MSDYAKAAIQEMLDQFGWGRFEEREDYEWQPILKAFAAMEAEVARLQAGAAAMRGYMMHREECDAVQEVGDNPCSCGLKAALAADAGKPLLEKLARLEQIEGLWKHALDCVDRVFQVGGQPEPPILPDFLPLGSDKFKGVIELAKDYLAVQMHRETGKVEYAELEASAAALRKALECAVAIIRNETYPPHKEERLNRWASELEQEGLAQFAGKALLTELEGKLARLEAEIAATSKVISDRGVCERNCNAPLPDRVDHLIVEQRSAEHWRAMHEMSAADLERWREYYGADDPRDGVIASAAGKIVAEQNRELASVRNLARRALEALEFYADPDTYHAIGFVPDEPCGDFMEDFEEVSRYGKPGHEIAVVKPGKLARAVLSDPLAQAVTTQGITEDV